MQLDLSNTELINATRGTNNSTYSVSNDKRYAIKLPSNPTTGFEWFLVNSEEATKTNLIEFLNLDQNGGGEYVPDPTPRRIVGGGGNSYFLFKTSENVKGQVELKLIYKRNWERDNIVKQISMVLNVGN